MSRASFKFSTRTADWLLARNQDITMSYILTSWYDISSGFVLFRTTEVEIRKKNTSLYLLHYGKSYEKN